MSKIWYNNKKREVR